MNRPLAVIYATVSLDAAGLALIFPILPGLLRAMTGVHEVSALFGDMLALYALAQFVGAPVLGVLSDRFGRRPVLLLSLAGSAVDYLIMAFTPYLWLLFVGRALAGLTAANTAVATAYIADITPEAERAHRFGLFQAFFGGGFVIGPVIGGVLGDISPRDPFFAAAALNGLNLLLAIFVLPESHKPDRTPIDWRALNPLVPLRWASSFRTLLPLLAVFLLIGLVGQTYSTVWVLFVEDRFDWTATEVGLSLGAFGALVVVAQGFRGGAGHTPARRARHAAAGHVLRGRRHADPFRRIGGLDRVRTDTVDRVRWDRNARAAVVANECGRCRTPRPFAGCHRQSCQCRGGTRPAAFQLDLCAVSAGLDRAGVDCRRCDLRDGCPHRTRQCEVCWPNLMKAVTPSAPPAPPRSNSQAGAVFRATPSVA